MGNCCCFGTGENGLPRQLERKIKLPWSDQGLLGWEALLTAWQMETLQRRQVIANEIQLLELRCGIYWQRRLIMHQKEMNLIRREQDLLDRERREL